MTIVINSVADVQIDGASVGCIADAFANFRDRAAEIYDALVAYETSVLEPLRQQIRDLTAERDANATARDALQSSLDNLSHESSAALADQTSQHNAAMATAQGQFQDGIRAMQEQVTAAQIQAQKASTFANEVLHGNTDAAKAVMLQLRLLDWATNKAKLDAEKASLDQLTT